MSHQSVSQGWRAHKACTFTVYLYICVLLNVHTQNNMQTSFKYLHFEYTPIILLNVHGMNIHSRLHSAKLSSTHHLIPPKGGKCKCLDAYFVFLDILKYKLTESKSDSLVFFNPPQGMLNSHSCSIADSRIYGSQEFGRN